MTWYRTVPPKKLQLFLHPRAWNRQIDTIRMTFYDALYLRENFFHACNRNDGLNGLNIQIKTSTTDHFLNCTVVLILICTLSWLIDFHVLFGKISIWQILTILAKIHDVKFRKLLIARGNFFCTDLKNGLIFSNFNFCRTAHPWHKNILDLSLMDFTT